MQGIETSMRTLSGQVGFAAIQQSVASQNDPIDRHWTPRSNLRGRTPPSLSHTVDACKCLVRSLADMPPPPAGPSLRIDAADGPSCKVCRGIQVPPCPTYLTRRIQLALTSEWGGEPVSKDAAPNAWSARNMTAPGL